mmetsp:Transcript_5106/g.11604  ORF Transcript_5106/g.11604 Transcript_5106/m.11604 type:complete len:167 (-) Transcript_5106:1967-2467(-)
MGRTAITKHAPTEKSKRKALARSMVALPFWSLLFSMVVVHAFLHYFLGATDADDVSSRGWMSSSWGLVTTTLFYTVKVAGACVGPALAWMVISLLVVCRYIGPFCPIGKSMSLSLLALIRMHPRSHDLQNLSMKYKLFHFTHFAVFRLCQCYYSPLFQHPFANQSL